MDLSNIFPPFRGVELLTTLYEDKACSWNAAHEDDTKRDKKEVEMDDYKRQMENSAITIYAYGCLFVF